MIIPKKIKIGAHIYKIILRDREKNDGKEEPATIHNKYLKIWIDKNWEESQMEASLLHEVIEALNYNYQIGLTHEQITCLAEGIYQVLKDNKLLKQRN